MVFEELYGDRVTCPHCEAKGARFDQIPLSEGAFEAVRWQWDVCRHCAEVILYKRMRDHEEVTSLWLADRRGEPIRRYVIFPEGTGRRVLWRMFVEDPLHSFLARQGFYDRYLHMVRPRTSLNRGLIAK